MENNTFTIVKQFIPPTQTINDITYILNWHKDKPKVKHNLLTEIPPETFVIVQTSDCPMVDNNVNVVGAVSSATFNSCIHGIDVDKEFLTEFYYGSHDYSEYSTTMKSPSLFSLDMKDKLFVIELALEKYRLQNHPLYPSRLGCIYAFNSTDNWRNICDSNGWDKSKALKYQLNGWPLTKIVRVNMGLVTALRRAVCHDYMIPIDDINDFIITQGLAAMYWSGDFRNAIMLDHDGYRNKCNIKVEPEYLIDGQLFNKNLKAQTIILDRYQPFR